MKIPSCMGAGLEQSMQIQIQKVSEITFIASLWKLRHYIIWGNQIPLLCQQGCGTFGIKHHQLDNLLCVKKTFQRENSNGQGNMVTTYQTNINYVQQCLQIKYRAFKIKHYNSMPKDNLNTKYTTDSNQNLNSGKHCSTFSRTAACRLCLSMKSKTSGFKSCRSDEPEKSYRSNKHYSGQYKITC